MRAAHARLDAYAQNPYPLSRSETPSHDFCSTCGYFTMARLAQIRAYVTQAFGPKPIWLTEYGYQTNPPDRLLGVSDVLQAKYIGAAKTHLQHILTAAAIDFVRVAEWLDEVPLAKTRRSAFVALMQPQQVAA